MSTTQEVRVEVQNLREQVREILLTAAEKSYKDVVDSFPKEPGEKLGAIGAARLRWAMLQGGFKYEEIVAITSKINAKIENKEPLPAELHEWTQFVEEEYLGFVTKETHRYTLGVKYRAYTRRLHEPLFNSHERMVVSIAKRLQTVMLRFPTPVETDTFINDLAKSCDVQSEMVWRVSTGGTRVTGGILHKMDHFLRQVELDLQEQDDAFDARLEEDEKFLAGEKPDQGNAYE